jgi:hypothetical protein
MEILVIELIKELILTYFNLFLLIFTYILKIIFHKNEFLDC